jgi:hypothetical protein
MSRRIRALEVAGMPDALTCVGRDACAAQHIQEESSMNRSISLSLTLAVALASQLALGGCNKKEDVAPTDSAASAPDMTASSSMSATSAPMDSISSASAVAGADAASSAASDAAMAASR